MTDKLDKNEICSLLDTNHTLIVLDTTDSTNLYLKNLAKNAAAHNTVVIADTQTNGRGRLGRSFFSPPGTGIYMSILLKPDSIQIPLSHITIAAGVAVCCAIKSFCKESPLIKWVNDIFISGKKVCGILSESFISQNDGLPYIIVGIGINVSTEVSIFPYELSGIAGSIFPVNTNRNSIIATLLKALERTFSSDNIDLLIDEYKKYSMVLNKEISFSLNGNTFSGTVTDINKDGNLIVLLPDGKEQVLNSGEVSLGSGNFAI